MCNWKDIQEGDLVRWSEGVPYDGEGSPDMVALDQMDTAGCGWITPMDFILDGKWHRVKTVAEATVSFNAVLLIFEEQKEEQKFDVAYSWEGFIDYMEFISPKKILKGIIND